MLLSPPRYILQLLSYCDIDCLLILIMLMMYQTAYQRLHLSLSCLFFLLFFTF